MAREVIIRMSDDFDRSLAADEIIEFTYEGVTYTIDLTTEHAEEFKAFIKPYMEAAHEAVKVTKAGVPSKRGGSTAGRPKAHVRSPDDETTATRRKIREWAIANGYKVQERGLISQELRDAYSAATGIPVRSNVPVLRGDEVTMDQLELIQSASDTTKVLAYQERMVEAAEPAHIQEARQVQARLSADEEGIKQRRRAPNTKEEGNYHGITPEMRDWARDNGHEINAKGYIPKHVRELFEAEQAEAASRNGVHV